MEQFRNRPDLSLNVAGGVITEVRDHLAVSPALPSKSTGGFKTAEFTEGFPLLFHRKVGGAFNNLLIISGYLDNAGGGVDNFENFMRDCKNLNLIGGSHNAQPSMNVRPAMLEGKAPITNTSRFDIMAYDTVYVIWLPASNNAKTAKSSTLQPLMAEYDAAFGQMWRGDHTFRFPLVIGGKSLTSGGIKEKIYNYVFERVATACNPVNALELPGFNPDLVFTKDVPSFEVRTDHVLYMRLEQIDALLSSDKSEWLTPFKRLCFLYIMAKYGALTTGTVLDTDLLFGTNATIGALNTARTNAGYRNLVNVAQYATTKPRRDSERAFHRELKKTASSFIYPLGIALQNIPSDRRGMLHVQSRV